MYLNFNLILLNFTFKIFVFFKVILRLLLQNIIKQKIDLIAIDESTNSHSLYPPSFEME